MLNADLEKNIEEMKKLLSEAAWLFFIVNVSNTRGHFVDPDSEEFDCVRKMIFGDRPAPHLYSRSSQFNEKLK